MTRAPFPSALISNGWIHPSSAARFQEFASEPVSYTHLAVYKRQIDVITGVYSPTGVLPLTLPKDDSVIAVDENGDCISPNDVPGYAKDSYMPDEMKDENGKAYAYRDSEGHYYESEFGLSF